MKHLTVSNESFVDKVLSFFKKQTPDIDTIKDPVQYIEAFTKKVSTTLMDTDWVNPHIDKEPQSITSDKLCIFSVNETIAKDTIKATTDTVDQLSRLVGDIEKTFLPWYTLRSNVFNKIAACSVDQVDKAIAVYHANESRLCNDPTDSFGSNKSILLMGTSETWPVAKMNDKQFINTFGDDFTFIKDKEFTANSITVDDVRVVLKLIEKILVLTVQITTAANVLLKARPGHFEELGEAWEAMEDEHSGAWTDIADFVAFNQSEADLSFVVMPNALDYTVKLLRGLHLLIYKTVR